MSAQLVRPVRPLDEMLQAALSRHDVPAAAALVMERGVIVAAGAAGVVARGGEPVEREDAWHIGSCAKAMTAFVLQGLVDEGVLAWSTTMAEVFPGLAADMHPQMREVTVEQLVDQRSGLPENKREGSAFTRGIDRHATAREQRRQIVENVLAEAPVSEPGATFCYANTNYLIAGAVVEQVLDRDWAEAMRRRLFAPLALRSAGFGQPPRVRGHQLLFGKPTAVRLRRDGGLLPRYYGPSGDVHVSLADWARFVRACLETNAYQAMPAGAGYRRGLVMRDGAWSHQGASPWWRAGMHVDRAQQRIVLVACNHGGEAGAMLVADVRAALLRAPGR